MSSKPNCADSLVAANTSQTAIPSPPTAIAPLSHEPLGNHQLNARSASVPTAAQHHLHPSHFQHIEPHPQPNVALLPHRQEVTHTAHTTKTQMENQSMHISGNYQSSMDHFEQQSYGSHYNSSAVVHPAINTQPSVEYNDANYYSSFYYDDQMRPYSASSNSCSSSNSDGDSQVASHHHSLHQNNNQDHSQQHQRHTIHHPNGQVLVSSNTNDLHTQNNGSHLDTTNLSPEYADCMDQRTSHHSFEVNCFGGIGNVGIHHLSEDLQSSYVQSNHGTGVSSSNSILLNGNASSGGSVLFNGHNLAAPQTIADPIQYTSVIVDSNNYHMSTDQYVH